MKNKVLLIGTAAVVLVVIFGLVLMYKSSKPAAPAAAKTGNKADKASSAPAAAATKALSKDMGGLTVKLLGPNGKEVPVKITAFKAFDPKSSVQYSTFTSNKTQELPPGAYDIEAGTVPAKIYKNINVHKGRDTVEDLGCPSGVIAIKSSTVGKKPAAYPVAVLYAKSNVVVARGSARKAIELLAGNYDVEIGSIPSQIKKEVRVDAGKETSLDLGPSGALIVRVVDSAGKKVRGSAKVKKAEGGELVASPSVNTQIDIMPGRYTVELAREPLQIKNDVNIGADEVTTVEFVIQTPASPPKPAQAVSIKKPGE